MIKRMFDHPFLNQNTRSILFVVKTCNRGNNFCMFYFVTKIRFDFLSYIFVYIIY